MCIARGDDEFGVGFILPLGVISVSASAVVVTTTNSDQSAINIKDVAFHLGVNKPRRRRVLCFRVACHHWDITVVGMGRQVA